MCVQFVLDALVLHWTIVNLSLPLFKKINYVRLVVVLVLLVLCSQALNRSTHISQTNQTLGFRPGHGTF